MPFPRDDYTPFGYLANPFHRARSWKTEETEAGLLRSTDDVLGFGWVEPTARRPRLEAGLALVLRWNERVYQTRADFGRLGYHSRHHSSQVFSYDWRLDQAEGSFAVALADRDVLAGELRLVNPGARPVRCDVFLVGRVRGQDARWNCERSPAGWHFVDRRSGRRFELAVGESGGESDAGEPSEPTTTAQDSGLGRPPAARGSSAAASAAMKERATATSGAVRPTEGPSFMSRDAAALARVAPALLEDDHQAAGFELAIELAPGEEWRIALTLARDGGSGVKEPSRVADTLATKRKADDAFYTGVALPVGDWPSQWKRGWVYDLETTRACVYPPAGIFQHSWPSWMITWPRVVVAEGTLDALRFSYAAPEQALALARTLFVEAPAANVPCVFVGGEPNMVAKDGTVCGTSPAWCLPFYNLWLLYRRTLDRAWLGAIFPRLEAYLDYWLRERTDEAGWIVYRCTYEAGEDCTPRLDPAGEGDEVISHVVRPVELQATLSQSAAILARFARELGREESAARWSAVADDYAARTQQLWDPGTGRFRDWDKRANGFLAAPGAPTYWQTDPVRFSPLSLTPLIAGLTTPEQTARLREEIDHYDTAPWCLWPSWSYVIAEAATTSGWYDVAGRFAARIVDRVYRANDRRTLAEAARPTPGTAPEFWPLDLAAFDGSDGYGWGATTTSLWVRQIFGFLDGDDPSELSFTLAPSLPEDLLRSGRRYGFIQMPYRGLRLDLTYEVAEAGLVASIVADHARVTSVRDREGSEVTRDREGRAALRNRAAVEIHLEH